MNLSIGLILCLAFELFWSTSLLAQNQSLISDCVIPETNEHDKIQFGVTLPQSYKSNKKSYPVIYYLHGLNGFYAEWKAQNVADFFTTHSSNGDIPECILVFPDGDEGFWCNHYDHDPLIEKEIIEFLIPYIDQNYSVDESRRLIMGWSAGGVGAMNFFSKYPGLFKATISLDGSITTWEEFVSFQGERPKIFNNSNYYYEYGSPNKWIVRNKNSIKEKQDTAIFLAAALFAESHQNFISILKDQGIPFKYKELNCTHEFGCVFSEISNDLLSFFSSILE